MVDTAQKVPIARTLNQWAGRRVQGALTELGYALPAKVTAVNNSIVTVSILLQNAKSSPYTIPGITCPIGGPMWARAPTQVGDLGVCLSADAYIGGVSGLGGGNADLIKRGNLSTLIFFPIGNSNWTPTDDPNSWVIYGPDGVIIRDSQKKAILQVSSSGVVTIKINGTVVATFDENGIHSPIDVQAGSNPVSLANHLHSDAGGSGDSGPPVPGT